MAEAAAEVSTWPAMGCHERRDLEWAPFLVLTSVSSVSETMGVID